MICLQFTLKFTQIQGETMTITEILASADPKHYVWWFPGSPVKVHLDLGVVKRLQDRLNRGGQPVVEQGLLFGRTHGEITEILDFQTVAGGNIQEMAAASTGAERKNLLVGYYRTQQEEALHLNEKDISLAEASFTDPYHVFLVIQSTGFGAANASFFFRAGGHLRAEFPIMEFPFDAALLAAEERNKAERSRPIALEKPAAQPVSTPAMETSPSLRKRHPGTLRIALVCLLAASILAVAIFLGLQFIPESFSRLRSDSPVQQLPAPFSQALLGLRAERQNGDLLLTWNRQSAQIIGATSGVLLIQDGNANRQIALDAAQVSEGSILYSPITDQVQMRLTVTTPSGSTTESVMVLLPKAGPPQVKNLSPSKTPPSAPVPPSDESASASRQQPRRTFVAPDGKRAAQPSQAPVLDSPPTLNTRPTSAIALPTALPELPHSASSPAPQSPLTLLAPAEPPQTMPHGTSEFHPPVAITKVMPEFPAVLRSIALKSKTVEVKVTIDSHGKVTKAEPVIQKDVSNFMAAEAVRAARLWKFQPALSGDQPVSSELLLRFTFKQ